MATVMITYDLVAPGKKYEDLHHAIKSTGSWWHCLESNWIVVTTLSTTQIRDRLAAHLDTNDKLLVAVLNGTAAWQGFDKNCSEWLTTNL